MLLNMPVIQHVYVAFKQLIVERAKCMIVVNNGDS